MNNFFTDLKQEAENIKLSQGEKQAMRASVMRAMETTARIKQVKVARVSSAYVWFSPKFAVPFAAVLVVVLGSGTAYASQAALPGDALYSIKVNVTEPALGALAFSDEAKAQWHAEVAETRLEEAETLASQGKLDETTSAHLAQNFDEHAGKAVELAQKVETEDPGAGVDIAAQIDSTLEAHDAILAQVADNSKSKQYTDEVATHVRDRGSVTLALANIGLRADNAADAPVPVAMTMEATISPEATLTAEAPASTSEPAAPSATLAMQAKIQPGVAAAPTSTPAQNAAQAKAIAKLKSSAGTALADAKKAYAAVKRSLDATTAVQVELQISDIVNVIAAASSTETLTGALKDATTLKAYLKASKNLKRNFFTNSPFTGDNPTKNDDKKEPSAATSSSAVKGEAETEAHATTSMPEGSSGKNEDEKSDAPSILKSILNAF